MTKHKEVVALQVERTTGESTQLVYFPDAPEFNTYKIRVKNPRFMGGRYSVGFGCNREQGLAFVKMARTTYLKVA